MHALLTGILVTIFVAVFGLFWAMEAMGEAATGEPNDREFLSNKTAGAVRRCEYRDAGFEWETSP
jgi:hypothetical protein